MCVRCVAGNQTHLNVQRNIDSLTHAHICICEILENMALQNTCSQNTFNIRCNFLWKSQPIDENSFHLHYDICFESFQSAKMRFDM